MRSKDAFSAWHPVVNFLFFLLVLLFAMFFLHPVWLGISFVCAMAYKRRLDGPEGMKSHLRWLIPIMLLTIFINPAFNHRGVTILTYLPTGNPLTLESIWYGLALSGMLAAVVTWFSCYSRVMTTDKFVYLFGRVIPSLSLVLSMTLRFVPRFTRQFRAVREAQCCVGRDMSNGSLVSRIRHAATVLSIMVTWSLENAIETADSMKSRGYGLKGRTAFSIYRFTARDIAALVWLALCAGVVIGAWASGCMQWEYVPVTGGAIGGAWAITAQAVYFLMCITPLILNRKEDLKWRSLQSKA